MKVNTAVLRKLAKEHPEWTYVQFAEATGQSVNTVRGVMHRAGLTNKKRKTFRVKKPVVSVKKPASGYVASRATSYRYGYTKLM